jgi:hypothetical protein
MEDSSIIDEIDTGRSVRVARRGAEGFPEALVVAFSVAPPS